MKPLFDPVFTSREAPQGSHKADSASANGGAGHVLLIEHRDEVFARLATDLQSFGCVVDRATTVTEAVNYCCHQKRALIFCHRDFSEESGWLIASKLHFLAPLAKIWLYASALGVFDEIGAKYSGIEDLLYYKGDISGLSMQLSALLWNRYTTLACIAERRPKDVGAKADAVKKQRSFPSFRFIA